VPFVKIATAAEVPEGKAKQVTLGRRKIALFNVAGVYYAIDDVCPHKGAPLSQGEVQGSKVICPYHDAVFDLTTGTHLCPPAKCDVRTYKVQVIGDEIQVEVA
jgi:3-phenylpropionate/trans-cinnamate dioxygenase ferredoxin component